VSASVPIRVLCVDDHPLVRDGLAALIALHRDLQVVGVAATGEEALERFEELSPDVTLMDLELPGMGGLKAIRVLHERHPDARIIVLTVHQGNENIYRALQFGATTYLLKDTLTTDLIRIIREVAEGHRPLPADVATRLADRAAQPTLTKREVEVLELVARGFPNRRIASALSISQETVHVHLRHIFAKLAVDDRTSAVNVALRRGIVRLP